MRLAKAIILRFLYGLVSLLMISFVTFVADEIAPGDAATVLAGEKRQDPENLARLRQQLGLNRPMMIRYVEYLGKTVQGDLGTSYYGTKEPVRDIIARDLPMTLRISMLALLLASGVGILLGTIAALRENRVADRAVLTLSTLGVTVPNFVLAPILVLIFCLKLDYLPQNWTDSRVAPDYYYLILPVAIMSARPMALLTRLTRASMVEVMKQEFIRTAVAKGVRPFSLVVKHGLRNAILPVVTAIGTSFGFLLTGSFVVERAFTLPGLGRESIEAIQKGDTPVLQATILVAGLMFITINLIVDILIPILDPRVRESQV